LYSYMLVIVVLRRLFMKCIDTC